MNRTHNGLHLIHNKVTALFFITKVVQRCKSCWTHSLELRSAWFISSPFLAPCYWFGPTLSPAVCGDRPGVWGLQSRAGRKSTVKLVILLSFTGGFVVKTQCNWNRTPVVTPRTQYPFHGQRLTASNQKLHIHPSPKAFCKAEKEVAPMEDEWLRCRWGGIAKTQVEWCGWSGVCVYVRTRASVRATPHISEASFSE